MIQYNEAPDTARYALTPAGELAAAQYRNLRLERQLAEASEQLQTLAARFESLEQRIFNLETQLVRANSRIAELSGEGTTSRYPVVAGGAGHGTDDGEHISFAEWRERKASRGGEGY